MIDVLSFVDEGLGHSSYLVDLGDGRALAVDPPRLAFPHAAAARSRGLEIAVTADTHSHADYISGSPELAAQGATFLASKGAHLAIPHHGVAAGDQIELRAGLTLQAIATPGHTPDHLAYLLCEDGRPAALFSGGSLMVGTVGRTDLLGPELRDDLARQLYRALRDEILTLPDDLRGVSDAWRGVVLLGTRRLGTHDDDRARTRNQPDARRPRRGHVRRTARRRVRNLSELLLTPAGGEPARSPPLLGAPDTRASRRHRSG